LIAVFELSKWEYSIFFENVFSFSFETVKILEQCGYYESYFYYYLRYYYYC